MYLNCELTISLNVPIRSRGNGTGGRSGSSGSVWDASLSGVCWKEKERKKRNVKAKQFFGCKICLIRLFGPTFGRVLEIVCFLKPIRLLYEIASYMIF